VVTNDFVSKSKTALLLLRQRKKARMPFSVSKENTMSEEELKALQKDMRRKKRIASEWASQLHDLVEDRLPAGYEEIPAMAQSTYDACKEWEEANEKLKAAEG